MVIAWLAILAASLLAGTSDAEVAPILAHVFTPVAPLESQNAACREQSQRYLRQLEQLQPWAVNMFDASAKLPSGVLRGNLAQFGDYDQCVGVRSGEQEHQDEEVVRGKYCLVHLKLTPGAVASHQHHQQRVAHLLDLAQAHSFFKTDFDDKMIPVPHPEIFSFGVCVPDACAESDVEDELVRRLRVHNGSSWPVQLHVRVTKGMCETKDERPLAPGAWGAIALLVVPFTISIISWIFEARLSTQSCKTARVLLSLSLGRNWGRLFDLTPDTDSLRCVHGIRLLFVILLYALHKTAIFPLYAMTNKVEMAEMMDHKWTVIFRVFWNYLDAFYLISGLLTAFYAARKLKEGKSLNILKMYMRRYYKFTGMLAVLVVFTEHLLPRIFTGPMALESFREYAQLCEGKSWTIFSYLAIFDGVDKMCYPPSNHVIMDMHMYLLAPFLTLVMWRRPRASALGIVLACAAITVYKYQLITEHNLATVLYSGIPFKKMIETINKLLFSSLLRFPNYMMGCALGVLLQKIDCKAHIPKLVLWLGHVASTCVAAYCICGPSGVIERGYEFDVRDTLTYGLLQPLLWPLALAWPIFLCATGNAKALERACSHPAYNVASRLTFAFNLVQLPVMLVFIARARSPIHFSVLAFIDLHELAVILAASVFLTLLFLMPLGELWDVVTGSKGAPVNTEQSKTEKKKVKRY